LLLLLLLVVNLRVTLNNSWGYRTKELHRTPNPNLYANPNPSPLVRVSLTDSVPLQQQWSGTLSAALGDRHQLLCSTYEDEIWQQSFLCGRASRAEQFASGSSSRGQFTLF